MAMSFWFYKVKSYKIYGCQVELKDKVIVYRGKWLWVIYIFIVIVIITVSNLQGLGAILLCIRGY